MSNCIGGYMKIDDVFAQNMKRVVFWDDFCGILSDNQLNMLSWRQSDNYVILSLIAHRVLGSPVGHSPIHLFLFTQVLEFQIYVVCRRWTNQSRSLFFPVGVIRARPRSGFLES